MYTSSQCTSGPKPHLSLSLSSRFGIGGLLGLGRVECCLALLSLPGRGLLGLPTPHHESATPHIDQQVGVACLDRSTLSSRLVASLMCSTCFFLATASFSSSLSTRWWLACMHTQHLCRQVHNWGRAFSSN